MTNLNSIKTYLKSNQGTASAEAIAHDVLKMPHLRPELAHDLVRQLLQKSPDVYESASNQWSLTEIDHHEVWILCKLFPAMTNSMQIQQIWMAMCSDFKILETRYFYPDSLEMLSFMGDYPMLFDGIGNQVSNFRRLLFIENPLFKLSKWIQKLFPEQSINSEADISNILGLPELEDASHDLQCQLFVEQAQHTWRLLNDRGISTLQHIEEFVTPALILPDFERYKFDQEFIRTLPAEPGVYMMKNRQQQVIYVGKAKNLAQRLQSYFRHSESLESKLEQIRDELFDIEITTTGNELAALLLEQELIDRFNPPINQKLQVHARRFRQHERYPRILVLPSNESLRAELFLLNPGKPFVRIDVDKKKPDEKFIKQQVSQVYFNEHNKETVENKNEEIVWSWLSQTPVPPQSMDMRLFTEISETLRVLKNYLTDLGSEPVVFY